MAKTEVAESPNSLSNIISGTEIKGDIRTSANIRFDGVLQGNLHSDARVVLGASSEIYGTICCRHADIFGKVEGKIFADELTMRATAILTGNITVRKVQLEPGCQFNGQCTMQDTPPEPLAEPAPPLSLSLNEQ